MKKLLLAFALFALPAQAQIIPTLPVTLTNGTLADANQVMSDFNTIVTGVNTNGAKNGVNSDITALNSLTTPITPTQGGTNVYLGVGSGTSNAMLVTVTTPIGFTLTSGYTVNFIPNVTSAGALTLSVAGTAAKAVLRQTSSGLQPLVSGEIFLNQMAIVIYDGTQYELINSAVSASVQPCTSIDYSGVTVPTGYLAEDGGAQSRTTFATLFSCLALTSVPATTSSGSAAIVLTSPTAVSQGWFVGGTNVTCNSTVTVVTDSTHITISNTAGGNGATTLTIGPAKQGDCSTTFNLPDYRGRGTAMTDLSGTVLTTSCSPATSIGTACGSQTQTLLTTNLPPYTPAGTVTPSQTVAFTSLSVTGGPTNVFTTTGTGVSFPFAGTAQGGTSTPFSTMQPTALVTKAIKF